MPIRPLLENHAFGPDEIRVLTTAFEDTLRTLRLTNRGDPVTEIIARKIIELAQRASAIPSNCVNTRLTFCRDRLAANGPLAGVWRRRQKAGRPRFSQFSFAANDWRAKEHPTARSRFWH